MSTSLNFHSDAALSTVLSTLDFDQLSDGSSPDIDQVVYLGSIVSSSSFQAQSDPADQITVSIVDAATGSGIEASNIKIALSSAGLDAAVEGDPLDVGLSIDGGAANAIAIYIRSDTPALSTEDVNVSLATNSVIELL